MNIKEKYLPKFCYYRKEHTELLFLIIHFFSGRYQFPDDPFDMSKCYDLFVDLNQPVDKRKNYKMEDFPNILYGSAKYLIGREGQIWQLVPDGHKQFHAGKSKWDYNGKGYKNLNHFSDGVELVNDGKLDYTESQYKSLAFLMCEKYNDFVLDISFDFESSSNKPTNKSQIAGHDDIAPGRKFDPGKHFDWEKLSNLLDAERNKSKIIELQA